jgi:hypothetical protein
MSELKLRPPKLLLPYVLAKRHEEHLELFVVGGFH